MEDHSAISKTESQFSSNMPYLEDSTPSETSTSSNHAITDDSVFVSESNNTMYSPISSPAPPVPRRSTRSTRGKTPERHGKYIHLIPQLILAQTLNAVVIIVNINLLIY